MAKAATSGKRTPVITPSKEPDVEKEIIIGNKVCSEKHNGNETYAKGWFCAAICADGSLFTDEADSPAGILDILSNAILAWVDFRTNDFAKEACIGGTLLGFSDQLIAALTGDSRLLYEDLDIEMGLKIPSIQIRLHEHPDVQAHSTLLLLRKNLILTMHPVDVDRRFSRLRRYSSKVLQKIPIEASAEDKLTILLIRIIDQNNDRNFEHLRQIEEHGDELNKRLMNPETPRSILGPEIYGMKHALISYLNALWETVDVLHDVRYGDAEIISDNTHILEQIGLLTEDVKQQIGLAEHLSEVLASGLEVLQSIYNNQLQVLNNRMAMIMTYLTILGTAVLVPNTLA
ncbi:MAG TPA: CorA family divalent cation transporter, partial [Dehalococcoidia bacterium]